MIIENLIAGVKSGKGQELLQSTNPTTQTPLSEKYTIATTTELNTAVELAYDAWQVYKNVSGKEKAIFLHTIALEIEALGDTLLDRAMAESGLTEGRLKGERARTCNQLRLFAALVEEGSWVNATIDKVESQTDIRKMSVALGPVAVFTASNFPLAFSTAGGDTASALAAGCPVIVKAHPSHLGTNAMVAEAITSAARQCNLPKGIFSSLQGSIETGQKLVQHPFVKAVGFTGSYTGGKVLFDIANRRPEPIPVYAEMGSNNPIFILEGKLKSESEALANLIANSVNLGAGQFCTNPGILVLQRGEHTAEFLQQLSIVFSNLQAATMLNEGIYNAYNRGKNKLSNTTGVAFLYESPGRSDSWTGEPAIACVAAECFLLNKNLQEEVFGPTSLVILCDDKSEIVEVANALQGQLTATIMATTEELPGASELIEILTQKAGRVIFNNVPTGVEVCAAMHHGGPHPSTSNAIFTSVGTDAIRRFVRPVCFQNFPDQLVPLALQSHNPLKIWRTVNGEKTKA